MSSPTSPIACVVGSAVTSGLDEIAQDASVAAGKLIVWSMGWWTTTESVDPNTSTVHDLQHYTMPVVALILVCSVLWQAFRMVLSRKPEPLIQVITGLAKFAGVYIIGLAGWEVAVQISDLLATSLITQTADEFGQRMAGQMQGLFELKAVVALLISVVLIVLSAIQWVLGFARQAGMAVLAVLLPLAAAGSINTATQPWLKKVNGWMVGLVAYKPSAALVYAIGFKLMTTDTLGANGQPITANDPATQALDSEIIGIMVLVLGVFCLPVMMKFFGQFGADSSGAGVAGVLVGGAVVAGGAMSIAAKSGGAASSVSRMERSGPGTGGGGGGPTGATTPPSAGPTPGPSGNSPAGGPSTPNPTTTPSPTPPSPNSTPAPAAGGAAAGGAAAAAGSAGAAAVAVKTVGRTGQQLGKEFGGSPGANP